MASSLFGREPRPNRTSDVGRMHPVLSDYQQALQRGDRRAQEAQQLLSANSPQQLQQLALNMLKARGLTPEGILSRLGLR